MQTPRPTHDDADVYRAQGLGTSLLALANIMSIVRSTNMRTQQTSVATAKMDLEMFSSHKQANHPFSRIRPINL